MRVEFGTVACSRKEGRPLPSSIIESLEARTLLSAVATTAVAGELQRAILFAQGQLTTTATVDLDDNSAEYVDYTKSDGTWDVTGPGSWASGAWPSQLWEMYELTGNTAWKTEAQQWSTSLVSQDSRTSDSYLRVYDPFIYAYNDDADPQAAAAIITAANARVTTYNPAVGAWSEPWRNSSSGNPSANFGVLLDQTMDTQEVFWAAAQTGNTALYTDAVNEMTTAERYLVRPDGSTAQFAYFNATTGAFVDNETYAGYSASSTWSRGQAWAINSFTDAYSQTHRADFLATAESVADYYIDHMPADGVPYWDFEDPAIPNADRDTSAAAIAATGLLQLTQIDPTAATAQKYYAAAETILGSLGTTYLALGSTSHGILLQGDDINSGSANDASMAWGDYYFLKAADLYLNRNATTLSVTPAAATVGVNQTQSFTAAGFDQYGQAVLTPVTWTASAGTITPAGVFTAPATAGTVTITAAAGGITGSATVSVIGIGTGTGGSVAGTVTGGPAGETVYLDANNNSILDAGEIRTTMRAGGSYTFSDVPAGAYIVRQILPAGTTQTSPGAGYGLHIAVAAGQPIAGENFVDTSSSTSVSGAVTSGASGETIYLDANNNGTLDSGELRTTTGIGGAYTFSNVPVGAYVIRQVLPTGYRQTSPTSGYGIHISVAAGSALIDESFVDQIAVTTGTIAGTVTGGLAGETIFLDANNNGILDATELRTTTDSSGDYSFINVPAGAYVIRQVLPSGYKQISPSNGYGLHLTVPAGTALSGQSFSDAAVAPAVIADVAS